MTILKANKVRSKVNTEERRLETSVGSAENKVSDKNVMRNTISKLFVTKKLAFLEIITVTLKTDLSAGLITPLYIESLS